MIILDINNEIKIKKIIEQTIIEVKIVLNKFFASCFNSKALLFISLILSCQTNWSTIFNYGSKG